MGWVAGSLAALGGALLVGLLVGPATLPAGDVLRSLVSLVPGVDVDVLADGQRTILWELRAPRVVLGAIVGATLAAAGAAYQGLFRNPLADPYFLGVSAGAGLGATIAIVGGLDALGPVTVPLVAFVGATGAVALTWTVGRSAGGRAAASIILAGVAVSLFLAAIQTFLQITNVETLREVYGFLIGTLTTGGWREVAVAAPFAVVSVVVLVGGRRLLDVLAVGDLEATALGLSTRRVRLVLVLAATLGTAGVVAVSGLIGFVGIVVPHTIRLLLGSSYRLILPFSVVLGATFLVLADALARTVVQPAELPIGIITAFVGGPFFLVVLRTSRRTLL